AVRARGGDRAGDARGRADRADRRPPAARGAAGDGVRGKPPRAGLRPRHDRGDRGARPPERRVRGAVRVPVLRLRQWPLAPGAGSRAGGGTRGRSWLRDPARGQRRRRDRPRPRRPGRRGGRCRMTAELGPNRYGKSAIRLVRVDRSDGGDRIRDLTVAIALEGDFAASYVDGDNSLVVATDTMKNTAYALAAEHLTGAIETYAAALGRHFLEDSQVSMVTVSIDEFAWRLIGWAPDAFTRDRTSTRTCVVAMSRDGLTVDAGIADLVVMKTSKSAFSGFPRDEYTTLAETDDRLLATKVSAVWRYLDGASVDYDASFEAVSRTLLDVFAEH